MRGQATASQLVPELIPVRMVNEHVYCPRLAHLEWASQLFADNHFTVDGRWQHRAVDEERGAAPAADGGDWVEARSVELSSPKYGLIGKADVIEGNNGVLTPVDTKRGKPAPIPEQVWLPERVQVRALGLLLEDNGYECHEGAIYFVETRERVTIEFTDELTEITLNAIAELRENAANPVPPPPLDNSTKCDGCSLVGICLPDEIPLLRKQRLDPPRRLMPADGAARPLYVTEPGAYVGKKGGRINVTKRKEPIMDVRLIDVSQLCIFGNVQVSTQMVRELMSRDVPICWFSGGGWLNGITEPLPSKNVELRRQQVLKAESGSLDIARAMIDGKIRNSRTLLRRNTKQRNNETLESLRKTANKARHADSVEQLLGLEGTAARLYFQQFSTMIRSNDEVGSFDFNGRNRRPPLDPVNCLLSFSYALLTKDCVATLRTVGFDPYLGFYHRPRFGRPALALDLAEELRSVVADSVVLKMINNGEIKANDFIHRAGAVALTADGRKAVIEAYEKRMATEITHPIFKYKVTWRRIIEVQARILAATVLGEIDEYRPMLTR